MTLRVVGGDDPSSVVLRQAAMGFGLLASPTRLHMLWVLTQGGCDVTTLADRVGGTVSSVSQHLAKLKLGGVVESRREGRRQIYLASDPAVVTMVRLLVGRHRDESWNAVRQVGGGDA